MTPATEPRRSSPGVDVAIFLPSASAGGAERSLITVAAQLSVSSPSVELVLGTAEGPLVDEIPASLEVVDLGQRHLRMGLGAVERYLEERQPACVIATLEHGIVLMDAALRRTRAPTTPIYRLANTFSVARAAARGHDRLTWWLARHAYRRAPYVVSVSHGAAEDLIATVGVERSRVRVIGNPVVTDDLAALATEPLSHPWFAAGQPPVVVGMGRLTRQKNVPLLVRAFALVHRRHRARLAILGDGDQWDTVAALVEDLRLQDDVDLVGFDPNPFRYLARAAVFASSSDWEGLPAALIQALACGAPVVATDCPSGPREILAGGTYGRLVPTGDVDALAVAIAAALEGGRQPVPDTAWQPYTVDAAMKSYRRLIDEAIVASISRRGAPSRPAVGPGTTSARPRSPA